MKYFLTLLVIALFPCSALAAKIDYNRELNLRGVFLRQAPKGFERRVYRLIKAFPEVRNVEVSFVNKGFNCGEVFTDGCFHWDKRRIEISTKQITYSLDFVLLHEFCHSIGIEDEREANICAAEHLK